MRRRLLALTAPLVLLLASPPAALAVQINKSFKP